jgi:hypothetical protein
LILSKYITPRLDLTDLKLVFGSQINHLAMGHHINHPKKPNVPNVFMSDITIEKHFLPNSFLEYLPCNMFEDWKYIKVMGVFLMEEMGDDSELLVDLKDLYIFEKEQ